MQNLGQSFLDLTFSCFVYGEEKDEFVFLKWNGSNKAPIGNKYNSGNLIQRETLYPCYIVCLDILFTNSEI